MASFQRTHFQSNWYSGPQHSSRWTPNQTYKYSDHRRGPTTQPHIILCQHRRQIGFFLWWSGSGPIWTWPVPGAISSVGRSIIRCSDSERKRRAAEKVNNRKMKLCCKQNRKSDVELDLFEVTFQRILIEFNIIPQTNKQGLFHSIKLNLGTSWFVSFCKTTLYLLNRENIAQYHTH